MKKSKITPIRWPVEEYRLISDEAWANRMTFSAFIRCLVFDKFRKA